MGITVQIKPAADRKGVQVTAGGRVQHLITDEERADFGLDDAALKSAVATYFGKAPDDAFLKGPTLGIDLYQTRRWPQVETVLVAQSAQLLELSSMPPPECSVEIPELVPRSLPDGGPGVLKARIVFAAYLIGATALQYRTPWKGHHFWALDVGQVMLSGGIQNHRRVTRDVTFAYSSSAELVARVA
jgi:hypothetical protein